MAFPVNAVVDDFNRSDRTLNGDGIWASGHMISGEGDLAIVSNKAETPAGTWHSAYTTIATYGISSGLEVYWTAAISTGSSQIAWLVANPNGTGVLDCYQMLQSGSAFAVYRTDNG